VCFLSKGFYIARWFITRRKLCPAFLHIFLLWYLVCKVSKRTENCAWEVESVVLGNF
jgi:hypothetical protein